MKTEQTKIAGIETIGGPSQAAAQSEHCDETCKCQATGYEAICQNFQVLYYSIFDWVRDFVKDEAFNQQDKTLRKHLRPELVVIDDVGLNNLPKHSGSICWK